jgi:hypothetical protein
VLIVAAAMAGQLRARFKVNAGPGLHRPAPSLKGLY